jgi:hypothetical protein
MKSKPETTEQRIARQRAMRLKRDANKPKEPEREYPVYGLKDRLRFGKFKDKTIEEVFESEDGRGWIIWALENVKGFTLDKDAEEELRYHQDPRRPSKSFGHF